MKFKILHLLMIITSLMFSSCNNSPNDSSYYDIMTAATSNEVSYNEALSNKILFEAANEIEEKYNLELAGFGGSAPRKKLNSLSLCVNAKTPLTIQQVESICIDSTNIFLLKINSNEELKDYLRDYPFTYKNFKISIHFPPQELNGKPVLCISQSRGTFYYFYDEDNMFHILKKVPYEEVLNRIQKNDIKK